MKNDLRSSIRLLVSPFEANDPEKAKWRQISNSMVEEVLQHRREVREAWKT